MTAVTILNIVVRWVHVGSAAVLTGTAFYAAFIFPAAMRPLAADARLKASFAAHRGFKMVVHPCILLLLLSGAYNAWRNWGTYNQWPGITHGIFGAHLLAGLLVMTLLLIGLVGKNPKPSGKNLVRWALIVALGAIAAASTLKWAREKAHDKNSCSACSIQTTRHG